MKEVNRHPPKSNNDFIAARTNHFHVQRSTIQNVKIIKKKFWW